jgi:hypothetical protein
LFASRFSLAFFQIAFDRTFPVGSATVPEGLDRVVTVCTSVIRFRGWES